MTEWIERSMASAKVTDVGSSPDECEVLEKKFLAFSGSVRTSSHLVTSVLEQARDLIAKGHSGLCVHVCIPIYIYWYMRMYVCMRGKKVNI